MSMEECLVPLLAPFPHPPHRLSTKAAETACGVLERKRAGGPRHSRV